MSKKDDVVDAYQCPKHSGERKECEKCSEEDIEEDESNTRKMWIIGGVGLLCAFLIWLALHAVLYFFGGGWEKASKMGDSFGSVNALISGLAFIALTYTIHLQRKELGLQRKELSMTRDELSKAAKAQKDSSSHQATIAKLDAYSLIIQHHHRERDSHLEEIALRTKRYTSTLLTQQTFQGQRVTIPDTKRVEEALNSDPAVRNSSNLAEEQQVKIEELNDKIQKLADKINKNAQGE